MHSYTSIAIDGPASSGKSTVSKILARDLAYIHIDTGAMYRSLTLQAILEGVSFDDEEALSQLLAGTAISFQPLADGQCVLINGKDQTREIRSLDVTNNASEVSAHPKVRLEMVDRQRKMAQNQNVIMDGRDIGSYVLPNASYKFFLDASLEERTQRRHKENVQRGIESSYDQLKKEIASRDEKDRSRDLAPLIVAEDAILIDTSNLTIAEVVGLIKEKIQE